LVLEQLSHLSTHLLQLTLQANNQCTLICCNLLLRRQLPVLARNLFLLCSILLLLVNQLLLLLRELQGQGAHGWARFSSSTLLQELQPHVRGGAVLQDTERWGSNPR
jgi:hypothetical protein